MTWFKSLNNPFLRLSNFLYSRVLLKILYSMLIVRLMESGRVRNLRFFTTLVPRRHVTTTCLTPDTGNFSFMVAIHIQITQLSCDGASARYVAVFRRILPYSASHNILPNSASRNILPNSAKFCQILPAVLAP